MYIDFALCLWTRTQAAGARVASGGGVGGGKQRQEDDSHWWSQEFQKVDSVALVPAHRRAVVLLARQFTPCTAETAVMPSHWSSSSGDIPWDDKEFRILLSLDCPILGRILFYFLFKSSEKKSSEGLCQQLSFQGNKYPLWATQAAEVKGEFSFGQ